MELFFVLIFISFLAFGAIDLISLYVSIVYQSKQMSVETSDRLWSRRLRRMPRLYIASDFPLELLRAPGWLGSKLFFRESLWQNWSLDEREASLFWGEAARLHYSGIRLLAGVGLNIYLIDRDAVLMGAKSLSLLSALEKADRQRQTIEPNLFGWLFSGWSLLGSSWFYQWPSLIERSSELARSATKLEAEAET